jgi:tellurite resistance protein TerC
MGMFRFLKHGVSFILFFIGAKMLLSSVHAVEEFFSNHTWVSLVVIISTLAFSVLLSLVIAEKKEIEELEEEVEHLEDEVEVLEVGLEKLEDEVESLEGEIKRKHHSKQPQKTIIS